jgi:hypothetical protein
MSGASVGPVGALPHPVETVCAAAAPAPIDDRREFACDCA